MNIEYKYIVVEGPIGVGKTTFAEKLAEHYSATILHEVVEENPFLSKFYQSKEQYAFSAQMFFLMSRYQQLKRANQLDLFNATVVADYMLEKDHIFARLNLNRDEFALYNEVYNLLSGKTAKPDLAIFLTADEDTLIKRVCKRGRAIEAGISEEYIKEVNETYHKFFFAYEGSAMLQINTNEIDIVNNDADFEKLLEKLNSPIRGKEFFNPLGSI